MKEGRLMDKADRYHCLDDESYSEPGGFCEGCGNGIIEASLSETCDDRDDNSGDGCSSTCTVEAGYGCVTTLLGYSECDISCGNGLFESVYGEQCDDDDTSNGDGCSSTCQIESTHTCTAVANQLSVCTPI